MTLPVLRWYVFDEMVGRNKLELGRNQKPPNTKPNPNSKPTHIKHRLKSRTVYTTPVRALHFRVIFFFFRVCLTVDHIQTTDSDNRVYRSIDRVTVNRITPHHITPHHTVCTPKSGKGRNRFISWTLALSAELDLKANRTAISKFGIWMNITPSHNTTTSEPDLCFGCIY